MTKSRNNRSKRSLSSLPKGLVQRKGVRGNTDINPFEVTSRKKRPKHEVHNRPTSKPKTTKHTLESLQRRQTQLRSVLKSSKKANIVVDRRIGQYDPTMSREDQMLARLVRERSRQSQRHAKFQLDDDDEINVGARRTNKTTSELLLTHKGKPLDPNKTSDPIYSDDDDDDFDGNLAAIDTELHFGGAGISAKQQSNPYGSGGKPPDLA